MVMQTEFLVRNESRDGILHINASFSLNRWRAKLAH